MKVKGTIKGDKKRTNNGKESELLDTTLNKEKKAHLKNIVNT